MRKTSEDCLHEKIRTSLVSNYNNNVFSAASLALSIGRDGTFENWHKSIGFFGENEQIKVDENSPFDLASLTKPLVTLPSILHLVERGIISWHDPLPALLERDVPESFETVELHNLLAHNSGFAAHENYWQTLKSMQNDRKMDWLINEIIGGEAAYKKESRHIYSDLGYLLLGAIIEIKSGQRLDAYWRSCVALPLEIEDNLFFPTVPDPEDDKSYVSTGICPWSGCKLSGIVNDDNSRALGGITGHAGLFGSAKGVLALCEEFLVLYSGKRSRLPIAPETFKKACLRVNGSEWTCGFNLPSATGSSSGRFFSPNSLGHLGFTGVSFWIDADRGLIVCLLTNRVIQGEDKQGIQAMRPQVHDAVATCLKEDLA